MGDLYEVGGNGGITQQLECLSNIITPAQLTGPA